MCTMGNNSIVVGNEFGLALHPLSGYCTQLWFGDTVTSVACLHDSTLWFSTAHQRGYTYRQGVVESLYRGKQVTVVSGPCGMVGTTTGTLPTPSIAVPCTRIVQSATLVAAWHVCGHIFAFAPAGLSPLYVFDTGPSTASALSVVGDLVCIAGCAWRGGRRYRACPDAARVCSTDGRLVLVRGGAGAVGIT